MQPRAISNSGERIGSFLDEHKLDALNWINASTFHQASMSGGLDPFIQAIANMPLIVVGPAHLQAIARSLRASAFVEVPGENCYLQLDRLCAETERALRDMPQGTFLSVSAGMPANVLIDRLNKTFGDRHMLVDIGSLWDPYAGVLSRNYMRRLGTLQLPNVHTT
jgi:hypothetical protein